MRVDLFPSTEEENELYYSLLIFCEEEAAAGTSLISESPPYLISPAGGVYCEEWFVEMASEISMVRGWPERMH